MKRIRHWMVALLVITILLGGSLSLNGAAEQESIIARVMGDYMLRTAEGELIEVADTDMGADLLRHAGKLVEVFGEISGEQAFKGKLGHKRRKAFRIIRVFSYTVIKE